MSDTATTATAREKEEKRNLTIITVLFSAATVVSGIIGGWVGSQTTMARLETRVDHLEKQRTEDQSNLSRQLEYWRAQQEGTGRDVSAIKAILERDNGNGRRSR